MPRENNPNILLKSRKLPAKQDEPFPPLQPSLSLSLPRAKPLPAITLEQQFHPETPLSEPLLQPIAKAGEWSPADEVRLSELHNQLGNRWSLISQSFEGKSDNCVKNHFFSRLRMSLRHINKKIPSQSAIKPIKMHVLYKVMSTCQERFNPDSEYTQQFINFSYDLKNKLLDFLFSKGNFSTSEVEKTVEEMHTFNKQYKMRADILKIPKTSRVPKTKRQGEIEEIRQDDDNLSQMNQEDLGENENNSNVSLANGNANSIESILEESWRFSEVLQLRNDRMEIKMVDTSEYLFNDEQGLIDWPHLNEAFRMDIWNEPLI